MTTPRAIEIRLLVTDTGHVGEMMAVVEARQKGETAPLFNTSKFLDWLNEANIDVEFIDNDQT